MLHERVASSTSTSSPVVKFISRIILFSLSLSFFIAILFASVEIHYETDEPNRCHARLNKRRAFNEPGGVYHCVTMSNPRLGTWRPADNVQASLFTHSAVFLSHQVQHLIFLFVSIQLVSLIARFEHFNPRIKVSPALEKKAWIIFIKRAH